ncbi:WD40 repeat domain-containing protein [Kitasatospora sp. NPDC002551]|uniref:WD40 repeat domain-containing protein n=1 Tax=Kitasatospora sp. NPDC002551 TaxID=3154539 RepID=UPI0033287F69
MSGVRARVLALVLVCLAAVGAGIGVGRWQSDAPAADGADDQTPARAPYTLTEVPLPGGDAGRATASAALGNGLLLVGTSNGRVYYVDPANGATRLMTPTPAPVRSIRVSADGGTAAVLSEDGAVRVMNLSRTTPTDFTIDPLEGPGGLSPDGGLFVYGSFEPTVVDVTTGRTSTLPEKPVPDGGRTAYEDWAVTGDGLVRAAGLEGVETWDPADPDRVGETIGCGCASRSVRFNGDGSLATFGTADGHTVVVDLTTGRVRSDKTVAVGDFTIIWTAAVLGDGRRAAAGTPSGVVVWDVEGRRVVWEHAFPGHHVEQVGAVPHSTALFIRTVQDGDSGDAVGSRLWLASPAAG